MNYILETKGLSKNYKTKKALDNVSIHVEQGAIYGLVGRNGAGKTTLMKIICGLIGKSAGSYSIFGKNGSDINYLKQRIGLLIESPGVFDEFDALTNLKIKCSLLGIRGNAEPERLLKMVGLEDTGKKKTGQFSLGMKQRLGIGMALAGKPDIVVLDEPINGLDPQGIIEIRDMIRKLNKENGTTFIISSHILDELSKIATKYGIINYGKLAEEILADELFSKCESRIELVTDNPSAATTVLEKIGFTQYKVMDEGRIYIYEQFDRTADITLALAAQGINTLEILKKIESVEDYYMKLVGET